MVSLSDVQSSDSRIASSLPPGLVAVFVGATSGIGEATLKQFATHARQPRVYFVGRSQEAGDRITAECKALNSEGEYIFVKADVSLIRVVDDVCRDIKSKETAVNLLFLSTGTMVSHTGMSCDSEECSGLRRTLCKGRITWLTIARTQRLQKAFTSPWL
jgi:NADP-dependent 3-hydroxy acid dehydrogenase YdfG